MIITNVSPLNVKPFVIDENFKYEVHGKDNIDNQPPKEFYDFRVYVD